MFRRVMLRQSLLCGPTQRLFTSRQRLFTTAANDRPLEFPDPPTSNHHDLQSFLEYSSRVGLDISSTVYTGTHYEYTVQAALARLSVESRRYGAANDRGIDLLGGWKLPSVPHLIRVFVQCKILNSQRAGPVLGRELEGAFRGAPTGWLDPGVIGLLVTSATATKGLRDAMARSSYPMVHVTCTAQGLLTQMSWNGEADHAGLAGITVGQTYMPNGLNEIRLMWKDNRL